MKNTEFKKQIQREISEQGFAETISKIIEPEWKQFRTVIVFDAPLENVTMIRWMNDRFKHGVSMISKVDGMNTPFIEMCSNMVCINAPDDLTEPKYSQDEQIADEVATASPEHKVILDLVQLVSVMLNEPMKVYECKRAFEVVKHWEKHGGKYMVDLVTTNRAEWIEMILDTITTANTICGINAPASSETPANETKRN